jgi:hypothetical protein
MLSIFLSKPVLHALKNLSINNFLLMFLVRVGIYLRLTKFEVHVCRSSINMFFALKVEFQPVFHCNLTITSCTV